MIVSAQQTKTTKQEFGKLTDEDRFKLKIFRMHLRRLSRFTKPLYGKSGYTVKLARHNSTLKKRNLATELRMAAIINEIRSFMLNDDPAYFYTIANIALRYYKNDAEKVKKLREWKKHWKELFKQRTGVVVNTKEGEILKNWGEILDVLIYGKYVHNKKDKHRIYSYTEADPMLSGHIALAFGSIAVNIDKNLRSFDIYFIQPIIEAGE